MTRPAAQGSRALSLHASPGGAPDPRPTGIDTPLVYVQAGEGYALYWCPELQVPVLRLNGTFGTQSGLTAAIAALVELRHHTDTRAMVADLRFVTVHASFVEAALTRAGIEGLQLLLVAGHAGPPIRTRAGQWRFGAFAHAADWLRHHDRYWREGPPQGEHENLLARGGTLIVGNYSGCGYWTETSHLLTTVYSGDDRDSSEYTQLIDGISAYVNRHGGDVFSVLIDVRHRAPMSVALQERAAANMQLLRAHPVRQIVLVGERPLQPSLAYPVNLYRAVFADTVPLVVTADFDVGLELALEAGRGPVQALLQPTDPRDGIDFNLF